MSVEPWVGTDYGKDALSVFVLGESSYRGNRGHPLPSDWNRRIICSFLEKNNDRTIKGAMDVFYDSPPDPEERHKFWQRTAFANCVQVDMGKPGNRPRSQEWREGQTAFRQYLVDLQPQLVLAIGFGTWDNLPDKDKCDYTRLLPMPPFPSEGAKRPWLLYPIMTDTHWSVAFVIPLEVSVMGFGGTG
jgi:hypothetical protein